MFRVEPTLNLKGAAQHSPVRHVVPRRGIFDMHPANGVGEEPAVGLLHKRK